jgi:gamma-glutamyltranspeptidase/glutathione hydrolase
VIIEAKKLAYADMLRYVGDPGFGTAPVVAMLSKDHAKARARLIDPAKAACSVKPSHFDGLTTRVGSDTIYLAAIDKDGNIVSLIQSLYSAFGSGVVPPGTGFMLHNRGALFTLEGGHPNALAPRKRPLQTVIPAFMKRLHLRVGFGVMGGWNQPQAHVQVISNIVDHGLNIQQALEAPRFTKLTFAGTDVMMEARFPESVREALARRGHEIDLQGEFSNMVGGGQAVMRDERTKVNYGASDPRKDGAAIPEPMLS